MYATCSGETPSSTFAFVFELGSCALCWNAACCCAEIWFVGGCEPWVGV